jgi:hypothetical protein
MKPYVPNIEIIRKTWMRLNYKGCASTSFNEEQIPTQKYSPMEQYCPPQNNVSPYIILNFSVARLKM